MYLLDKSLATPAENLALDEALLELVEAGQGAIEVLRLWESSRYAAVLGRSSQAAAEVDIDACRDHGISILRRTSGGSSVLIGPGCLMYSAVLSYQQRPELRSVEQAHRLVLGMVAEAANQFVRDARQSGTSDLTIGGRKFSGNSLRCRRDGLLYHGTLLYDFPLDLISDCLRRPPRQPEYRGDRDHSEFVMNLDVRVDQLRAALIRQWGVKQTLEGWPCARTTALAETKFADPMWTYSR